MKRRVYQEKPLIPSFSWESPDQFLKEGTGYIALEHPML